MSKNHYEYYGMVCFHGGTTKILSEPFHNFRDAWNYMQEDLLRYCDNSVDFAGVIKSKEGKYPFYRIKNLEGDEA